MKGLKVIKSFKATNCCFAVKGGLKLAISDTPFGYVFPAADGAIKCNPKQDLAGMYQFFGAPKLELSSKITAKAACTTGHNPGVFMKKKAAKVEASWVKFGVYDYQKSPGGGWELMTIGDMQAQKAYFIKLYNANSGVDVIKPFKSGDCCFAFKGGKKLKIKDSPMGFAFPAKKGMMQCHPNVAYSGTVQFFGTKLTDKTVFTEATGCKRNHNPGFYMLKSKSTPKPTSRPTTAFPSASPSAYPTSLPTSNPTKAPTNKPTAAPTAAPTNSPTPAPTPPPTKSPTNSPTQAPTVRKTSSPTSPPTAIPKNAKLEFGVYDFASAPGAGWKLMKASDYVKFKDQFVTSYNKNKGVKVIRGFKAQNCCFAVAGGKKLTVSGTPMGYQFPAGKAGGILCNPATAFKGTLHFFGSASLKMNAKFGEKEACQTGKSLIFNISHSMEFNWFVLGDSKVTTPAST